MGISKTGIASLIVGLVILALTWMFHFETMGITAMVLTTILGGIVLLGLFFAVIGLLMVVI